MNYKPPRGVGLWHLQTGKWRVRVGKKFLGTTANPYHRVFDSEKEAVSFCRGLNKQTSPHIEESRETKLTPLEIAEARMAFSRLQSGSLLDAVDHWNETQKARNTQTIGEVIEMLFLEQKRRAGDETTRHPRETRSTLKALFGGTGKDPIATMGFASLSKLLEKPSSKGQPVTNSLRNRRIRAAKMLFNFAVEMEIIPKNPIPHSKKNTVTSSAPVVLSPQTTAKLILSCKQSKPEALAGLLIKIFSGVRNPELFGLRWEHVEEAQITVPAAFTKTDRTRTVAVHPTLWVWLEDLRGKDEELVFGEEPKNRSRHHLWYAALQSIRSEILDTWPQNALRHLFGSYHFALHRDETKTSSEMGNSVAVIRRHYLNAVRGTAAELFWSLTPGRVSEIANKDLDDSDMEELPPRGNTPEPLID